MRLKPMVAALAAVGVFATGSAGALSLSDFWPAKGNTATAAGAPPSLPSGAAQNTAPNYVPNYLPNYRAIVQAAAPAVVGITVEGTRKVEGMQMPDFGDDPFFQFFRGLPGMRSDHGGHGGQGRQGGRPQGALPFRGQGSGFVVSSDGVILTNAHVVRDAKEVTVKFQDRRELRAKVLGADPATDVAVLKVDATGLATVALGDSKTVEVGDYVLAIGAPYGFEQSATQGIVSAKRRSLPGDSFVPFIQTDAAVNPGTSGGPLFDAGGRVIGMNAQIYSQSGGFQGLAFAIPIDVALRVKDQIASTGRVEHARLGVMLQDLNQSLAESFDLKTPDGALVSSVGKDSAAARAELKPGDVITHIDGQTVHTAADVSTRVGAAKPGETVKLTVWRDKSSRELTAKLGSARDDQTEQVAADDSSNSLGLAVRPLSPQEKSESRADGLLVQDVQGASARAGIQPGDIVLALNGKPVTRVEQIRAALAAKPKTVALLIQRDDQQIFVPIRLG
jgi:serine protease Do